jgi:hypothetical protein
LFSGHGVEIWLSVGPRKQLIDVAVGMTVDDSGEDVGQIGERIDMFSLQSMVRKGSLAMNFVNTSPFNSGSRVFVNVVGSPTGSSGGMYPDARSIDSR